MLLSLMFGDIHSFIIISDIIEDKLNHFINYISEKNTLQLPHILYFPLLFDLLHFLLSFISIILYSSLLIFNKSSS